MGRRLYVGNLPYSTTDEELNGLFSRAGQVESVRVMRDMATGRARGFAFVQMGSDEDAQRAITEFHQFQLDGRALVVIRPEHFDVVEAPDGPAESGSWRVLRRRFAGTEILYEVAAPDGQRLWVEAGPGVRRLRVGDSVQLRLRDVETVAFPSGHHPDDPVTIGAAEAPARS